MKGPATSSMRRKQNGRNTTSGSDMGGMEDYSRRSASSTDGQVNGRSCLIRISEKKNSNQRHSISDRIKSLEVKKMRVSPSSSNTIRRFDGNIAMRTAYSPGFSKPSNDTSCVLTSERLIEIAATKRILEEWSKHSRLEQNDEISDNTSDTEDTSSGSTNGYGNTGARSSSSSSTKNIPDNTEEVDIPNTTTHVRHMGKDDETLLLNKKLRKRSIELKAKNIQIASLQSLLVRREADNLALRDEIERQRIEIEALRTERVNVNQVNVVVNDLQSPTGMLRNRVHNLERGKEAMKSRADHLLTLLVAFERDMNEALY